MAKTGTAETVQVIVNRKGLEALRQRLGVRFDWHEPDNQGVGVRVVMGEFDNAMCQPGQGEAGVVIEQHGEAVAYVNLALLFAFATGHYQGIGG